MIPRYGPPPRPASRIGHGWRRRPGAYAILIRDGWLLLTHQQAPVPEFQLPGGGIDPGESPVRALHREVGEETGWTIAGPRFLSAYRRFAYMPDHDLHAEKLCEIWLARPIRRLGPPSEPGHSAHWVRPAVAADLLADPGARAVLSRWLKAHG
ncbi:MAG: NUDIX hydrolase [Paracoccus sp. (in: a-proteobacteria)]|jgi:8-oxo-dGTP diphosphatase|uniref:NUDIX hydrolase n=1 Tax=Paracoccus sp. TaxID=267 RepID=UPI003001248D